ncbi:MAG: glycosyltransferase [Burkholderiales bacterium]|nr:glycosyltransferase [Bacteroidia bacterium]
MEKKKIIVSVINDLVTDQRVARTCSVLFDLNYKVLLVGREQKSSRPLEKRDYDCKRMKLYFEQGPQFYLFFNLRLFFVLLFTKADALLANDLDTLLPNYLVSKIKGIPLIYDSHEIFCEVPELQVNSVKKRIWEKLESRIVPKLKYCVTVNQSIADYFINKYKMPFIFVRNIPDYTKIVSLKSRTDLDLPIGKKIVILQGAGINVQRGAEELVEAFKYLDETYFLLIVGSGDVIQQLKENVIKLSLQNKVKFINKIPASELRHYTSNSNLGVTIDKDTNMNYHFSLPNKVFDYMHAGIPILATKLPEIENLVNAYHIGTFIENHQPQHIAEQISSFLCGDEYLKYKSNTVIAAIENNWKTEKQKLIKLINEIS